jgi:DNA repair protein RadC
MKNEMIETDLNKVTEVQLVYKTSIKPSDRPKISKMEDAVEIFRKYWSRDKIEHIEEVKILLMNRANRVLGIATVSMGGVSGTVMDERIILQYAIKANASGVIMAHNHPSGTLEPSDTDKKITSKIKGSLELMGMSLLDHIVITVDGQNSIIDS